MKWTIIVALKALPAAKSRLATASPDPQQHANLVEAIRADTLAVAAQAGRVLAACDDPRAAPPLVQVVVQVQPGLNAALREAADYARERWPADGIAALVGDLPALTTDELVTALRLALVYPRAFVADAAATGTTLLTALPGVALEPAFGPGSGARHARIAREVSGGPGLRLDVDTAHDLEQARLLGLGPSTRRLLDS